MNDLFNTNVAYKIVKQAYKKCSFKNDDYKKELINLGLILVRENDLWWNSKLGDYFNYSVNYVKNGMLTYYEKLIKRNV